VEPRDLGALRGRGETVLLVEDEEQVRHLTERILTDHGYSVIAACGGPEAIQTCSERVDDVDLLLTDVIMPQMSGSELAERLRGERPDLAVLYMSGYTGDTIARQRVLPEDVALVEKPFSQTSLLHSIDEALETVRAESARHPTSRERRNDDDHG
jgi:CheY-like chemotaxis protein